MLSEYTNDEEPQAMYFDQQQKQPGDEVLWNQQRPVTLGDDNTLPRLSHEDLNILSRGDILVGDNRSTYGDMDPTVIDPYDGFPQDDYSESVEEMDEEPLPEGLLVAANNGTSSDAQSKSVGGWFQGPRASESPPTPFFLEQVFGFPLSLRGV